MSAKKNNARIQKWREMLSVGLFKDPELLHSRTRKGVPASLRNIVWPKLVNLDKHIEQKTVEFTYKSLLAKYSSNVYEISLDIPRTFPQQQDSKALRKSMNDVLKAISISYPKIGYCQGMNFLTRRILQVLDNQQSFWLLHYLLQRDINLRNNFIDPKSIDVHNFIFDQLLQQYMPHLLKEFQAKGVYYQAFTMKSFMTIFSGCLKQEPFNRVFQVYLLEGWSIIYAFALALFKNHQKKLKQGSMEELQQLLSHRIFQIENIDYVMNQAYKLKISQQKVKKLDKTYNQNLRQSQKIRHMLSSGQIQRRNQKNIVGQKFKPQLESLQILNIQTRPQDSFDFQVLEVLRHKIH